MGNETTLENYFERLPEGDVLIKGTRVGIETVLEDYLQGISPEEIALRYRALTLEQIYATVTYYLRNQAALDSYLAQWRHDAESAWQKQAQHPSAVVRRLLAQKAERQDRRIAA